MYATAFLMGFVGSLHCIGMCGPLLMLLPKAATNKTKYVAARILYNTGRILTYAIIGLIFATIGQSFMLFFSQKWLSLLIGFAILLFLVLPKNLMPNNSQYPIIGKYIPNLKSIFRKTQSQHYYRSNFLFGIANGFLPCGLVYGALAGAFLQPTALSGALFMMLFGIGTLPMMLSLSIGIQLIKFPRQFNIAKLIPLTYALIACWLIFRGLNLNIPQFYQESDINNITQCH